MSAPRTYRPPAWSGLAESPPRLIEVEPARARVLFEALGRRGTLWALSDAGGGQTEFYRLDAVGGERLFLKVVPGQRIAELVRAERIATWLEAGGVAAMKAFSPEPLMVDRGRGLFVYAYCGGRRPRAEDAAVLGAALARLHARLSRHPERARWARDTQARLERLRGMREALAAGSVRAGPEPERLAALAADPAIDFDPGAYADLGPCIPLHGDLNLFNVLIDTDGPVFLDFEDVHHSCFPAAFDLALLCERVILLDAEDEDVARNEVRRLLGAYHAAGGGRFGELVRYVDVLRGLALRSLCTLAEIDVAGDDSGEWGKFFFLLEFAVRRRYAFS